MSIELISVLVAVVAIGAALAGVILTSIRGLRQDMREDIGKLESRLDERISGLESRLDDLDHLTKAASEPRQLADQQTVAGLQRPQHLVDAALERTLARRDPGLDELVDREAAFLAELDDRQLLVGEVLRTSGNAEVSDGFQRGVQEKVELGLFATVNDYNIRNIV